MRLLLAILTATLLTLSVSTQTACSGSPQIEGDLAYSGSPSGCHGDLPDGRAATKCAGGDVVTVTVKPVTTQQGCDRYYWTGTWILPGEPTTTVPVETSAPSFVVQARNVSGNDDFSISVYAENQFGRSRRAQQTVKVTPRTCTFIEPATISLDFVGGQTGCSSSKPSCSASEVVRFTVGIPDAPADPCISLKWSVDQHDVANSSDSLSMEQTFAAGTHTVTATLGLAGSPPRTVSTSTSLTVGSTSRRRAVRH